MTVEDTQQSESETEYPGLVKGAVRELTMEASAVSNDTNNLSNQRHVPSRRTENVDSNSEIMDTTENNNGTSHETGDASCEDSTDDGDVDQDNNNCFALCGKILRLMGDEQLCKSCGRYLRNLGDEIYYKQHIRNLVKDMIDQEVSVGAD